MQPVGDENQVTVTDSSSPAAASTDSENGKLGLPWWRSG